MNVDKEVRRLVKAEKALAERACKLAAMQAEQQKEQSVSDAAKESLVLKMLRQRGIFNLPAEQLIALVSRLDLPATVVHDAIIASAPPLQAEETRHEPLPETTDTVEITVQISRNAGEEKRAVLNRAGLRWNGKAGRWVGKVDRTVLAELQAAFGERVAIRQVAAESAPAAPPKPVAADEPASPSETPPEPRQATGGTGPGISGGGDVEAVQEGPAPTLQGGAATLPPARVFPRPLPRMGFVNGRQR